MKDFRRLVVITETNPEPTIYETKNADHFREVMDKLFIENEYIHVRYAEEGE